MAQVIVTPRARRDVDDAISALSLPGDAETRIGRSLRVLETFPLAGPGLVDGWARHGSWSVVLDDPALSLRESSDRVYVVAMHDARSAASATAAQG